MALPVNGSTHLIPAYYSIYRPGKDERLSWPSWLTYSQWCIAKNGGGYTQTGVAKGLKVPCLFMITEVSIRCQKNPEVGIRRIPAYIPQYTTAYSGWLTHISGHPSAAGRAQDRESSPVRDRRSTTVLRHQLEQCSDSK